MQTCQAIAPVTISNCLKPISKIKIVDFAWPLNQTDLHWVTLIGSYLKTTILRVVAKLESLFVVGGHHSLHILQWKRVELLMSEKFLHKYKAICGQDHVITDRKQGW